MATGWKDALMADTGAPWNIPYVEPADLVRDYPAADEAQALAIAAGLDDASVVKQVVQTIKDDTFSSTSTTFTDVTGLSASITPQTNTNKILVRVVVNSGHSDSTRLTIFNVADASNVNLVLAASPSSRSPGFVPTATAGVGMSPAIVEFLHSPNTTSPFTYKVRGLTSGGTFYVNRSATDTDSATIARSISSITLVEIPS
jgi:hypothetical protein